MSFASVSWLALAKQQASRVTQFAGSAIGGGGGVQKRWKSRGKNTVRIIVTQDVPDGKKYKNDVVTVKAGYARNFLIPKKMALYATRENFKRVGLKDPDQETVEERRLRLEREAKAGDDKDLKAADLLKRYLANKTLKMWRHIDESIKEYDAISPGKVVSSNVRNKLSRQLMIDLEGHEKIHLVPAPVHHSELKDKDIDEHFKELPDPSIKCTTEIKILGQYLARISLRGGYTIPLKFEIIKR